MGMPLNVGASPGKSERSEGFMNLLADLWTGCGTAFTWEVEFLVGEIVVVTERCCGGVPAWTASATQRWEY
jgi:hypothetical protein